MGYVITNQIKNVGVVGRLTNCGCLEIDTSYKEFPIEDYSFLLLELPIFEYEGDIQELKAKVICEYLKIIKQLECGIQPDLEFLLEEISLIDIYENE